MNLPPPDGVEKEEARFHAGVSPQPVPAEIRIPPPVLSSAELDEEPESSLLSLLRDALVYPWRDSGWMLIVPGGFMLLATVIAGFGFFGLVAQVLIGGYLAAHYCNVIETTISGRRTQPEWPEMGAGVWENLVQPAFKVLAVHLIATAPALLLAFWLGSSTEEAESGLMVWGVLAFDSLYFPLAMVAVSLTGNLVSAMPHHILPAILRGGWPYATGAALLLVMMTLVQIVFALLASLPWLGLLLLCCGIMWSILFQARYCGLLYRRCQDRIAWV